MIKILCSPGAPATWHDSYSYPASPDASARLRHRARVCVYVLLILLPVKMEVALEGGEGRGRSRPGRDRGTMLSPVPSTEAQRRAAVPAGQPGGRRGAGGVHGGDRGGGGRSGSGSVGKGNLVWGYWHGKRGPTYVVPLSNRPADPLQQWRVVIVSRGAAQACRGKLCLFILQRVGEERKGEAAAAVVLGSRI